MFYYLKETTGTLKLPYYSKSNSPETIIFYQLTRVLTSSQHVTRATERILSKSQDLMTFTEKLKISIQGSVVSV